MTYIIEATVKHVLWNFLENQNLKVCGEVKLAKNKRIDLVAKKSDIQGNNWVAINDVFVGYELKELNKFVKSKYREVKIINQILDYANSGFLDYLYICSPYEEIYNLEYYIKNPSVLFNDPVFRFNYRDEFEKFCNNYYLLNKCGAILLPLFVDEKVLVLKEADKLDRVHKPNISVDNEERIRHTIWRFYAHERPICEGVLPNIYGNKPQQNIDIIIFKGSNSPADILKNQNRMDLIGIEVKSSIGNKNSIIKQLKSYLDSSSLTRLYLAVPEKSISKAKNLLLQTSLLEDCSLQQIGIMSVKESGEVRIIKEASKLEMTYDSILINRKGSCATTQEMRSVGWGDYIPQKEWSMYTSAFVTEEESIERRAMKKYGYL